MNSITSAVERSTRTGTVSAPHFDSASNGSLAQIAAVGIKKSYRKGSLEIPVLRGVDMHVAKGEFVSIIGQSGSGKSTLLHVLGTLDQCDSGEVRFAGQRIDNLPARQRDQLRNQRIGMIFQFYHLLPELSALENVLAPLMITHGWWAFRRQRAQFTARATELLKMVGLGHRLTHKPREMSGGEMQRAAIARALIADPQVLLADEPTGNLDSVTTGEILDLLDKLNAAGKTIIMVTHEDDVAHRSKRIVRLRDGKLQSDQRLEKSAVAATS